MVKEPQAAELLEVTPRKLQAWRASRRGPRFMRYSARAIRYRVVDLMAWTEAREYENPSEY